MTISVEQCVEDSCGMGHGIPLLLPPVAKDNPAHMYIEFARLQSIFLLHQNLLRFWLCFSSHLSSKALFNLWLSSAHLSWPYSSQTSIGQGKGRLKGWSRHVVHFCSRVLPCCQAEHGQGASIGSLGAFREKEMVSGCPTLCPPRNCFFFFMLLTLWSSPLSFTAPQNYFVLLRFFSVAPFFWFC